MKMCGGTEVKLNLYTGRTGAEKAQDRRLGGLQERSFYASAS
jgi:hypothetical protein